MNIERLTKLADFLDTVPEKQFDLSVWGNRKLGCGFVGCAIGWAASIPEFRADGFDMKWSAGDYGPAYGVSHQWEAVEDFFEVDFTTAEQLFSEDEYSFVPQPKDVATRIRELVAGAS